MDWHREEALAILLLTGTLTFSYSQVADFTALSFLSNHHCPWRSFHFKLKGWHSWWHTPTTQEILCATDVTWWSTTPHDMLSKNTACAKTAHKVTHVKAHNTESRKAGLVPSFLCVWAEKNDSVETQTAKSRGTRGDEKLTGGWNIRCFVMTPNKRRGDEKTYKT